MRREEDLMPDVTEESGSVLPVARRVLLKLSGEMFGGGAVGLDPIIVRRVAEEIAVAIREGVEVAIVVGGGNFFRGAELSASGMERARADYMGMLGTVMNALALQDFLEPVSYTHLRAHETKANLVCRLLLEKKK